MRIASLLPNFSSHNYQYTPAKPNQNQGSRYVSFGSKYDSLVQKMLTMFKYQDMERAIGLSDVKKASDGSLLSFKKVLPDGKELSVTRNGIERAVGGQYLLFKETGLGAFKDFIAIDLRLGQIICMDRYSPQKPVYEKGRFKDIPLMDDKHAIYEAKLEEWFKQIFPQKDNVKLKEPPSSPQNKPEVLGYKPQSGVRTPIIVRQDPPKKRPVKQVPEKVTDPPVEHKTQLSQPDVLKQINQEPKPTSNTSSPGEPNNAHTGTDKLPKRVEQEQIPSKQDVSIPVESGNVTQKSEVSSPVKSNQVPENVADSSPVIPTKRKRGRPPGTRLAPIIPDNIGILPEVVQNDLKEISKMFADIMKIRGQTNGRTYEWNLKFNEKYPALDLARQRQQKGTFVFRYNENESISVKIEKRYPETIRFFHYSADSIETPYIIDDNSKIISNIWYNKNHLIKPHAGQIKYYTAGELEASPVSKYIKFVREELEKYHKAYMDSYNKNCQPVRKKRVPANTKLSQKEEAIPPQTQITKPKENVQPATGADATQNNIPSSVFPDMGETLNLIRDKAARDADTLAKEYVTALVEQFQKRLSEVGEVLKGKFSGLFD